MGIAGSASHMASQWLVIDCNLVCSPPKAYSLRDSIRDKDLANALKEKEPKYFQRKYICNNSSSEKLVEPFTKLRSRDVHLAKLTIGTEAIFGFDFLVGRFFDFSPESFPFFFRRDYEELCVNFDHLKHPRQSRDDLSTVLYLKKISRPLVVHPHHINFTSRGHCLFTSEIG